MNFRELVIPIKLLFPAWICVQRKGSDLMLFIDRLLIAAHLIAFD